MTKDVKPDSVIVGADQRVLKKSEYDDFISGMWSNSKEGIYVYIDDKAIRFENNWKELSTLIQNK